jgi:hypothetical protein
MLPTLIDRALARLFNLQEREGGREQETDAKKRKEGRMRVSINHDLNQISTSACVPRRQDGEIIVL